MVITYFDNNGLRHITDMSNVYKNGTAFLIGGGPSLLRQNTHLLHNPGVVTMCMNNSALITRPTMWCGADYPECYDYSILADSGVIKFTSLGYYDTVVYNKKLRDYDNMFFFTLDNKIMWENVFNSSKNLPWFNNLFFTVIFILYNMGIRKIVLVGCPFKIVDRPYAADIELNEIEIRKNKLVYSQQLQDLIGIKPILEDAGLTIVDATIDGSLKGHYETVKLEDAVASVTVKSKGNKLWHCTHFNNINKKYIK